MLYQPPAFREDRPDVLHALIRSARLGLLASQGAAGLPDVTHLPLHLLTGPGAGDHGTLLGHVARGNPHWRALAPGGAAGGRAVAVFRGAEAYVSPNWYASKAEHHKVVPTWNYEAVHAEGAIEVIEDADRLHALVTQLTDAQEAARAAPDVTPWRVADAPAEFVAGQLRGIVGLSLRIERLVGKRKLSQNRPAADRDGAAAALEASPDPRDRATAAAMRRAAEGR